MMLQFVLIWKCFVKTSSDYMLVRTGFGDSTASNNGLFVVPFLHHLEKIPLTVQKLSYERTAKSPLLFQCGTTATLKADFLLRVNATAEDAERAITFLGAPRLNDRQALEDHFSSAFNDSLETIALQMPFSELANNKELFRQKLMVHIGNDLNGMVMDDVGIHHLMPNRTNS